MSKVDKKNENKTDAINEEIIELNADKKEDLSDIPEPKPIFKLEDKVIQQINIDKNLVLKVYDTFNGLIIDIRKYYKGYPTKRGLRFSYGSYKRIRDILNNIEK